MIESETDLIEIEKIAENLLVGSKAYDIFPTPVEDVLSYAELVVDQHLDLSRPLTRLKSVYGKHLRPAFKKVLGILDRSANTILLDQSMNENRKRFVQLHEVGHKVLPWQAEIMEFADDEYTIDPSIQVKFEGEASYLASCVLFQKERFSSEIRKFDLSIKTPMDISKKYGASIHATIRRYVLNNQEPCALLVLHPFDDIDPCLAIKDSFESPSFRKKFGKTVWPEKCSVKYGFVFDAANNRRFTSGECVLINEAGERIGALYQHFFNGHNHLVLFSPK